MTGKVSVLSPSYYQAWDDYVDNHIDGTFYHLSGWKQLIEDVYRHRCHFLYCSDGDKITGILPLVEQKSFLFGHSLISMPICVLGGAIADNEEIESQLLLEAKSIAQELKVDYLELRSPKESATAIDGFIEPEQQSHVMIGCPLAESDQAILAAIKKKQRAVIRQSLKNNLTIKFESTIDNVYHIYSTSVRNLGTPVFPKKSFVALKEIFKERCEILTVFNGETAVSSVMSFYYKGHVLPHYGGGLTEARSLKSNDFMYYSLMCHAREQGCHYFDFGRSKIGSGSYKYKMHWGMEQHSMYYQYCLVGSQDLPSLSANNPKYQMVIKVWQRLPLFVSQLVGPMLARHLG